MRARLAIAVSGQRCELREVLLKNKPPELLAASPKATVPVLVLPGGEVIEQSLDIMLWALRQNDPALWLAPPQESIDAMLALVADNDGAFKQQLDRYKYPNRYPQQHSGDAPQFAREQRAAGARWLAGLEARLAGGGWLFGQRASLADMAILPFVRQFAHTDAAWFALQPWPHLVSWLANWESGTLFERVMEKYPPWQAGQMRVEFPPVVGGKTPSSATDFQAF